MGVIPKHGKTKVGGDNGCQLRAELGEAVMEYCKISSYRAIVASTSAILNTDHDPADDREANEGRVFTPLDHRLYLVRELLRTEREYFSLLQMVLKTYAEPFRKLTALPAEDHRVLFVGLEPLISLSAMISSKLDEAVQTWDSQSTKVGNLFSRKYWSHYEDYADGYSAIESTLEEKYDNDDTFVEFLDLRRRNSEFGLEDLLRLPVQRIPEYDKFLNDLLQETDPGHPDYDNLSRAAANVRNMLKEREDEICNMENQRRMDRVQDKFPHDDLQLRDMDAQRRQLASRRRSAPGAVLFKTLGKSKSSNNILSQTTMGKKDFEFQRPTRQNNNFNRQYMMEGHVEFSRGLQTQDRYLFLFSDLLLVAKPKSNTTFKLKHRIRVCELWLANCIDDISELTLQVDTSFVIGWPTVNVVATFKSIELKNTWLNKLTEQIEVERSKQLPRSLKLEIHHKESEQACQVEVETTTDAVTIVKSCLEQLNNTDPNMKDYQLWVRLSQDDSPYPLCGHELPYAIKLSHIRDYSKRPEDNLSETEIQRIMTEMQNNHRRYEFFLKHNKKSPKKHSLEESSKNAKGKRRSPLISLFRRNREDKKPQGRLFGHSLSSVASPEALIAQPVKELLMILFREGPYTVGILRKSCNAKMLKELKQLLDDGEDCLTTDQWPPLVIGAIVKDYLRNIPGSLLSEDLFDDWSMVNAISDREEKYNKLRDTISKLPAHNAELLRHLMCVLYHIDKKSDDNKMTAYNLSVCIAPSLLWPKGNPDPLASPPAIIQFMIENCAQVFGEQTLSLFGEFVEQKLRQDSSTDSDSMHSVLSTHSNFRRDDSSIDSIEREVYTGEMDPCPNIAKMHHFSPSNLSGDSGLTLSDSQLYDEDGNGNEMVTDRRGFTRSVSQFMTPDMTRLDLENTSRSLDSQYYYDFDPQNPIPPPRRTRRKGSDTSQSPNFEFDRKMGKHTNSNLPGRYDKRAQNEKYKHKRRSTESLKSVEESTEADPEMILNKFLPKDIGTLTKSASGAHLYFDEVTSPTLFEFENINRQGYGKRAHLYKQSSEGHMPMSPQSKYSLNSSRDSVLSDSSGSFLNRQNSPDPLSSSADTPDHEDSGMSQWLSNQSKQTAEYANMQQRHFSQDDSDIGLKSDSQTVNKVEYIGSPKSSPKLKRRSPIPLSIRRSFPLQVEVSPKGSGSNTSKEAEDIIKSPKFAITYSSQESLNKLMCESPQKDQSSFATLDSYNNNSGNSNTNSQVMKQLQIYSTGLQGTSPPPRVVLQGLGQTQPQKRDNVPVKGNHEIFNKARRSSFDMGEIRERKHYPMEENSVSSEDEETDSESDVETCRITTMIQFSPMKFGIPKKVILDEKRSSSSESLSKSSNNSEELNSSRPENPPNYDEALQRSYMIKNGILPDDGSDTDTEKLRQQEASLRARQLFEQSTKQYQERERALPSQQFEQKLKAVGEKREEHVSEGDSSASSDDDQSTNPRRYYEESLKRYEEQCSSTQTSSVKVSPQSEENVSNFKPVGVDAIKNKFVHGASAVHRSNSDVIDMKKKPSACPAQDSNRTGNHETVKRSGNPPPYNAPPPYHCDHQDSSPSSVDRHYFPKTSEQFYTSDAPNRLTDMAKTHERQSADRAKGSASVPRSSGNAQTVSVPKRRDHILVSNRARNVTLIPQNKDSVGSEVTSASHNAQVVTDNSVHSAQSELGKYTSPVTGVRTRGAVDPRMYPAPANSPRKSDISASVFKPRPSSSTDMNDQRATSTPPKSAGGPISYRNPNMSRSSAEVNFDSSNRARRRNSLDAAVNRNSLGMNNGARELPWSVKNLSNMFDKNRSAADTKQTQSQSSSSTNSSPVLSSSSSSSTISSSSRPSVPPPYTPPPPFQRRSDNLSNASSNSSMSSCGTVRTGKQVTRHGPQARDSFSSTDDSECSCRYAANNHNNGVDELDRKISYADISYV